jgi:DHA2 family multidrug resistance protein
VLTGLGLMGWSLHAMTEWNAEVGVSEIISTGIVQGIGLGFIFVPLSTIAFATLAPRYRNEGTAMFSLIRNIGSSVGISLVMTVLGHEIQQSHAALSTNITPFSEALQAPGVPSLWNLSTELGLAALDAEVTRQAVTIAYLNDFRFMMYLCLLAVPLLLLLRSPRLNRR